MRVEKIVLENSYSFFIGKNVNGKEVNDTDKIVELFKTVFKAENFTFSEVKGYYNGEIENTVKIEIFTHLIDSEVEILTTCLAFCLEQECILMNDSLIFSPREFTDYHEFNKERLNILNI